MARQAFFSWDSDGGVEIASDEGWFEFVEWVETLPPDKSACLRELYGEYSVASPTGLEKELRRHVRSLADGSVLKSIAEALLDYIPSRPDESEWLCVWDGTNWVFDRSPEHNRFWDKSVKVSLVLANDASAAADNASKRLAKAVVKAAKRKRSDAAEFLEMAGRDAEEALELLGYAWAEYVNDTAVESQPLLDDCWKRIRRTWKITHKVWNYVAGTEKQNAKKPAAGTDLDWFDSEGPLNPAIIACARAREAGRLIALAEVAAKEAQPYRAADRLQKCAARASSALSNVGNAWAELTSGPDNPCSAEENARAMILLDKTWTSLSETISALSRVLHPANPSRARKRRTRSPLSGSPPAKNALYLKEFWESEFGSSIDSDARLWEKTELDPEDGQTWLNHLDDLASLEVAAIDSSIGNDRILRSVGRLKRLRSLDLALCENVTPEGVRELKGLKSLEALTMCNTADRNSIDTWPTDAHLEALPDFPRLWYLDLSYADITEFGIKQLARFPGLRALILDGCEEVTDETLEFIASFSQMQWLSLQECTRVTDHGLQYLAALDNLRELHLGTTDTSVRGRARLRALLPQCRVD